MNELCVSLGLSSSELAAWVQAIGSIVALVIAVGVAIVQSRAQHSTSMAVLDKEHRVNRTQAADTLLVLTEAAVSAFRYVTAKFPDREAVHSVATGEKAIDLGVVRALGSAVLAIPLHQLPSALVFQVMIVESAIRQYGDKVELVLRVHRSMDDAAFDDFFSTLREIEKSMSATKEDIARVIETS